MASTLYVANLSQTATLASMRELFGACGDVLEVEFAAERSSRSAPSAAYVTMATSLAADRAMRDLHGRLHGDRVLMVSRVAHRGASTDGAPRAVAGSEKREAPVAMTQQYRDRHALTYELSCSGKRVTLRFVFPVDDQHGWQLEAGVAPVVPGSPSSVTAGGMTREQALRALIAAWREASDQQAASELDWDAISAALRAVRAL